MDAERIAAPEDLYVRGRDVVTSYLAGADVTWDADDEDVVEALSRSGRHRRIRVSVTDGPGWTVSWYFARPGPTVFPDGWWAFVRVDAAAQRESEVYLAPENEVRELLHRIVSDETFDERNPDLVEAEQVRLDDDDLRPLLRTWAELTLTD
ncbi:hypothetical protein [Georgenia subflava]|uniref:Uncharacterized protein n=1 Tax=Georgenia subflava TaxID=1622177 RepID=A0A6N7EG71_9MICO|nr:hypothetical protein [Georgenia subflava]MPV37030.1 hypothetical protein [Georgenia subflava]